MLPFIVGVATLDLALAGFYWGVYLPHHAEPRPAYKLSYRPGAARLDPVDGRRHGGRGRSDQPGGHLARASRPALYRLALDLSHFGGRGGSVAVWASPLH